MKTFATLALAGTLALGACAQPAETDDTADTGDAGDTTIINEAPAEPVIVEEAEPEGSSLTIDGADVDAKVSEDGVQADINVGD